MRPTWIYEDDRVVLGNVRSLGLVAWREAPLAGHIRHWHELGSTIARSHPGTGACLDVVVGGTPSFADDMRKEAVSLASDPQIFELGIAHAIVVPGLVGTAVRAFVSTVILVSRAPAPVKVFSDLPGAVRWLAPRLAPHGWTEAELTEAAEALYVRVGR